jgi:hypothetical protein
MEGKSMSEIIITAVIIIVVASFLVWLFRTAPFLQAPFNKWGEWTTIAIAGIAFIVYVLIPLLRLIPGFG